MKPHYLCPKCQSHLVCCDHLILSLESESGDKKGLLMMNIALGDYSTQSPSCGLQIKDGELVNLFCPACHGNLKVPDINDKLVMVKMIDENGNDHDVYFSRVCGEQSTFMIDHEDVIEHFGKDASEYVTYFTNKLKKQMNL